MRISICLGVFLAVLLAVPAAAQKELHPSGILFVGFPKEGRLEVDGTGHFADLVNAMLAEAGASERLVTVPVRRARRIFEENVDVCIAFTTKEVLPLSIPSLKQDDLIETVPIDYVSAHLVSQPGTEPITDPQLLQGKTIGSWVGASVRVFLPDLEFNWVKTESEETAIHMLMEGRYDAIWSYVPDVKILAERSGVAEPVWDSSSPFMAAATHIVCRHTLMTELFMPRLNEVLETMRTDGRMKKILGKHARVVGVDVPADIQDVNVAADN